MHKAVAFLLSYVRIIYTTQTPFKPINWGVNFLSIGFEPSLHPTAATRSLGQVLSCIQQLLTNL